MKPWLFVLVAFTLLSTGCSKTTAPAPTSQSEGQAAVEKSKELAVDAERLAKDYLADAKVADAAYKDRLVLVTGYVDSTIKDNAIQAILFLEGAPAKSGSVLSTYVRCISNSAASIKTAKELKKGQKITVRGKCAGCPFGLVNIEHFTFVEIRPVELAQDRASFAKEVEQALPNRGWLVLHFADGHVTREHEHTIDATVLRTEHHGVTRTYVRQ